MFGIIIWSLRNRKKFIMISVNKLKRQKALNKWHFPNNFHNKMLVNIFSKLMHNLSSHTLHESGLLSFSMLTLHPVRNHNPFPLTPLPFQRSLFLLLFFILLTILFSLSIINYQPTQTTNILLHFLSHLTKYY